jgi:ribose transport system permease protein
MGILLAGFDGGAFTTMGDAYLLGSVAAVVVGGVPVSGGVVSTASVMFGALVMTLLITVLEISKLAIGAQDLIEGVTIVAMVLLTSRRARVRVN